MWEDISDIIATTIAVIIVISFAGAFFLGIGNLVIAIFNINFNWTFQHGVLVFLGLALLKSILKRIEERNKEEE